MSTSQVVKEAWANVNEADLPESMKEAAFREVLRSMLAGAEPVGKPRYLAPKMSIKPEGDPDRTEIDEAEMVNAVCHATGADADKLERLVMVDDGVIKLVPPGKDLGKSNAEATRVVAQILTIVGACGLDRKDTEFEVIRKECDRLRVYDSKNFASNHLKKIDGFVVKGTGSGRRLEPKSVGIRAFSDLVEKLVGGE